MLVGFLYGLLSCCCAPCALAARPRASRTCKARPQRESSTCCQGCMARTTHVRARRGLQALRRPLRSAGSAPASCILDRHTLKYARVSLTDQARLFRQPMGILCGGRGRGRAKGQHASRDAPARSVCRFQHTESLLHMWLDVIEFHEGSGEPFRAPPRGREGQEVPVTTPRLLCIVRPRLDKTPPVKL